MRLHAPRWPRNLKPSDRIYLFCSLFGDGAVTTPVHGETPAVSLGESAVVSASAVLSASWEGRGGEACLLGGAGVRGAQDGAFGARFDHELRATLKTTLPDEAFRSFLQTQHATIELWRAPPATNERHSLFDHVLLGTASASLCGAESGVQLVCGLRPGSADAVAVPSLADVHVGFRISKGRYENDSPLELPPISKGRYEISKGRYENDSPLELPRLPPETTPAPETTPVATELTSAEAAAPNTALDETSMGLVQLGGCLRELEPNTALYETSMGLAQLDGCLRELDAVQRSLQRRLDVGERVTKLSALDETDSIERSLQRRLDSGALSPPALPASPPALPASPPALPASPPALPASPPALPASPPALPASPSPSAAAARGAMLGTIAFDAAALDLAARDGATPYRYGAPNLVNESEHLEEDLEEEISPWVSPCGSPNASPSPSRPSSRSSAVAGATRADALRRRPERASSPYEAAEAPLAAAMARMEAAIHSASCFTASPAAGGAIPKVAQYGATKTVAQHGATPTVAQHGATPTVATPAAAVAAAAHAAAPPVATIGSSASPSMQVLTTARNELGSSASPGMQMLTTAPHPPPPVATIDLLHARALAAARSPVRRSPNSPAQPVRQSLSAPSTVRTSRAAPRHMSRIARILNGSSPRSPHAHDGAAHDDDGLSSEDEAESADEQKEQITISRA